MSQFETLASRRNFIRSATGAAVSYAALSGAPAMVHAAGSDEIKVGLIGCGGRGTGAASQFLLSTDTPVKLWAMGDLFRDQLDASHKLLSEGAEARYDREKFGPLTAKMAVPEERRFVGFEAYKGVLASGVDVVILATPPHFRPEHFEAAVAAGKHVFMEKPVGVDPVGIRRVIAAAKQAKDKGLSVVAGTQRRHQNHYREIIRRVQDGAIGEIVAAQCYWNMGELWLEEAKRNWEGRKAHGWSDMEFQCRNWLFYAWLSGDHICEQHVHNLDIIHWALGANPLQAMGVGGRAARTGPEYGNIYDHFAVEYEYPNGVRVSSMCKQMKGSAFVVAERLVGTRGQTYTDGSGGYITGQNAYKYEGSNPNPYYQEHADLIRSIREGKPLAEGVGVAESTMVAILGRMSTYTGRQVKWDWAMQGSKLDLRPTKYEFGPLPEQPVAIPGKTPLV
ncbi:MAG TPA: Gfo/Idh/MocA family oxidoreductase [Verrucomicrobiae bacterium]|nr:Gfo/Idh/MocA family oxidoreductase [Verrucomicrobiae bacterium]